VVLRTSTKHKHQAYLVYTKPNYFSQEPKTVLQAKTVLEWRRAMQDELNELIQNHTWRLVPHPPNKSFIGNKWVFRIKRHPDRTVHWYKARLVAEGYAQQEWVDYQETFSPVHQVYYCPYYFILGYCSWLACSAN
jgi:hypothetical protein